MLLNVSANATELSPATKEILKKKFVGISYKIDNSFTVNDKVIYLPLITQDPNISRKVEIVSTIEDPSDKNFPVLIQLSNGWFFAKLIKQKDGGFSIIDLQAVSESIRNSFLSTRFPKDLVIPKGFTLKEDLSILANGLQIKIEKDPNPLSSLNLSGYLYLTSPDTGKVVYLDLSDSSMIYKIQTKGAPWDISFDRVNKLFYVSDFAKDLIYTLKPLENSIHNTLKFSAMSSPVDIDLSEDGSLIYILESLTNKFTVYKTAESKVLFSVMVSPNPAGFSIIKNLDLIAISCPSLNSLEFLSSIDFSVKNQLMLGEGNPQKLIYNPINNFLYIANRTGNSITILDLINKKVRNTIPVGETPTALIFDSNYKFLFVANAKSNTINIIDLENEIVTDAIPLPVETQFPSDLKITPDNKWLFVTSETTNVISIIDLSLKQVVVKLDVGATTHAAYLLSRESK